MYRDRSPLSERCAVRMGTWVLGRDPEAHREWERQRRLGYGWRSYYCDERSQCAHFRSLTFVGSIHLRTHAEFASAEVRHRSGLCRLTTGTRAQQG
jgi:hypothetical protein